MPSDSGLTAAEQAALDADRDAEIAAVQEEAPVVETPAVPEGEAPAAGSGQEQPQRHDTVPLPKLLDERKQRQEAERQLAEERKARATLEERTNIILQRFAAPQQQPAPPAQQAPEIPAFDQDPAGHILGQVRQQGAILGELVQAVSGQHRQNEAAQGVQQLTLRAAAMERDFAAANPDYVKASEHLFNMRQQELVAAGWTDPAEIQHMMASEATGLAARALQQGKNPAEVVYALAKLRGYNASAARQPLPGAAEVEHRLSDEDATRHDVEAAEGQLRTIAAGQQQARSVGQLRGSGPAPLTATRLAEMDGDEFLKMINTPAGRDLMGV